MRAFLEIPNLKIPFHCREYIVWDREFA